MRREVRFSPTACLGRIARWARLAQRSVEGSGPVDCSLPDKGPLSALSRRRSALGSTTASSRLRPFASQAQPELLATAGAMATEDKQEGNTATPSGAGEPDVPARMDRPRAEGEQPASAARHRRTGITQRCAQNQQTLQGLPIV